MARKLDMKVVKLANGTGEDIPFSYGAVILNALRFANPQQGLVLDDVLKAVDAQGPIIKAIEDQTDHVVLSEEQYRTVVDKVEKFPFAIATREIAEFGLHVRNAPELGTEKK